MWGTQPEIRKRDMAGAETSAAGCVQVRLSSLLQTKRWRPQEKTCGSVTLTHIQYVSLDSDGSFSDFALAEPVAINVFPVCPSYMKTWMTVPCRIGSLPHLDTAAQENEKSSLPPEWHWDEECSAYKQTIRLEQWTCNYFLGQNPFIHLYTPNKYIH